MTENLHVLVWGTADQGPCAYFRGHLFDEPLLDLGVELRHITQVKFIASPEYRDKPIEQAYAAGKVQLDTSDIEWADVIMFRRYYNTAIKCKQANLDDADACKFQTLDEDEAARHEHGCRRQDDITRLIWPAIRDHYDGAIIYETDDNHWNIKPWNGYYPDVVIERDLIAEMTRRADLVTVSTPALVETYGRYNSNIRVVRNAIDPALYARDKPRGIYEKPRLVYYGSTARMRDYAGWPDERGKHTGGYARSAVEAHASELTRVFVGTNPGSEHIIARLFDEQVPYITGIAAFSKALVETDGDIGIAPLGGDEFDRNKSELHWLEYAMADMAFIGERMQGRNTPYGVIEHGKDGLLARGRSEWFDSVRSLTRSRTLREELAGRAKERVLRDYDYRVRAAEWRDAFVWAAEHAGVGRYAVAA